MAVKKNVASQVIGAQMVSASDGSAFTGTVTVVVTVDGGTQSASGGTGPTHEGNGFHSYIPTQAETNGDHIAFTFTGTGAVPVTVQVYTTFPQTGDSFARLGAPAGASVSADIATVDSNVDAILADTGTDGVVVAAASKSGYSLTAGTGLGNQTADITGNLSGSVGSVLGGINTTAGTITTLDALDTAQDTQHSTTQSAISALNDPTAAAIADAVWDEVINASTHNVGSSAGQRLRQLSSAVVTEGTATAGAATSITLAVGSSAIDNYYNFDVISIVGGTGAGQSRLIVAYNGTTRVATVYRAWATNPDATSEYVIQAKTELLIRNSGLAQAGANNSITLATTASGIDDEYVGSSVLILAGTGEGQLRVITAYNGTSKAASVTDAWAANPDTTSVYAVLPLGRSYVVDIDADSLTKITSDIDSNSTQLAAIVADTNELQTDWANGGRLDLILDARASQATADAIEADTQDIQSRIPAALVGGKIDANVGAISASTAAADQLELNVEASLAGTASGTPTTTSMVSDIAVTVDDQFKGRIIIFQSDTTTAALRNQATDITACTAASNTLTFTALTTAPSSGDTFIIV